MALKSYFDLEGDGGSDIMGQVVSRKQAVARATAGVRRWLAVGSAKGGVGKSTVTLLLGDALRRQGLRVALLDADLNGPSLARLAGLQGAALLPGPEGIFVPRNRDGLGVISLGSVLPEAQNLEFASVAPGESFVWRATREFTALGDVLAGTAWGALDFLIVDLPPGAERAEQFAGFLGPATRHLLVSHPSALSRGVAARGVAALAKAGAPVLGWVENMSGYWCKDCEEIRPLFPAAGGVEIGAPLLARIPFDPELAMTVDRGDSPLMASASPVHREVNALAAKLLSLWPLA